MRRPAAMHPPLRGRSPVIRIVETVIAEMNALNDEHQKPALISRLRERCRRPYRWAECCIFVSSFVGTAAYVYHTATPLHHIYSDMRGYVERGWRLAAADPLVPFDTFFPPGTSYLYALVFAAAGFPAGLRLLVWLQILTVALLAVLSGRIAAELFHSRRLGVAVGAAAAVYFPFIEQAGFFTAEPPFALALLAALYLFQRAIQENRPGSWHLAAGLLSGAAVLCKSQGIVSIAAIVICMLFTRELPLRLRKLGAFLAGTCILLLPQLLLNSLILRTPTFDLSLNGPFNLLLGQSRRSALGCLDRENGYFYFFHNNNDSLGYQFLPPKVLPVSILDGAFFKREVLSLWQNDPTRQVLRSLQNMIELFHVNPRWPYNTTPETIAADLAFQRAFIWLAVLPAAVTLAGALCGRRRLIVLLLALPVLGMAAISALTTGQPRYLLPFQYHLLLLAAPTYLDAARLLQRVRSRCDR